MANVSAKKPAVMKSTIHIFRIVSVFCSSIIGAGFATGKEISSFFTRHSENSWVAIVSAGLLLSIFAVLFVLMNHKMKTNSFSDILLKLAGRKFSTIYTCLSSLFTFFVFAATLSGISILIRGMTGIFDPVVRIVLPFLIIPLIMGGEKGISIMSAVLFPLFTGVILLSGISIIFMGHLEVNNLIEMQQTTAIAHDSFVTYKGFTTVDNFIMNNILVNGGIPANKGLNLNNSLFYNNNLFFNNIITNVFIGIASLWVTSSFLYAGYNNIMALPVLSALCNKDVPLWSRFAGGAAGGVVLMLLLLFLNRAVMVYMPFVVDFDMPLLDSLSISGSAMKNAGKILLLAAMLASMTTSGYCISLFVSSLTKLEKSTSYIFSTLLTIPLSGMGFSGIINFVYPLFGVVGLLLPVLIVGKLSTAPRKVVTR